jgi:hypothetical protein
MVFITNSLKFHVIAAEFIARRCTRRQFRYHASPGMTSLGGAALAGDGSHSMDQSLGRG